MYWAMRTSRDSEEHRAFLRKELLDGRLRQGWGSRAEQDLRRIEEAWRKDAPLSRDQADASRHWRMGNGPQAEYMNRGDMVLIPNMPHDGLFTLVRIEGPYEFEISPEFGDFGHLRRIDVLTPMGVANENRMVDAGLRRSLRYPGRLWRIPSYSECLEEIVQYSGKPGDLTVGATATGRAESIVSDVVSGPIRELADQLSKRLPERLQGNEWETVIRSALEPLFPVTVRHTGGPRERGADLEIIISNPFDQERNWIVPVQVKDHEFIEGPKVSSQLEEAFCSRAGTGDIVIAVVLLVTNAVPSPELNERMTQLSAKYHVPFIYCGGRRFMEILARGFLKQM